jgi:hypothetical protein
MLTLWVIRLGLSLVPVQVLRSLLARVPQMPGGWRKAGQASPDRIAWAVAAVSRFWPRATCLPQALAAQVLLERNGVPSRFRIGVAQSDDKGFEAHAWVESQGKVVIGGSALDRYTPLLAVEGERR